jgi:hypothetical protein
MRKSLVSSMAQFLMNLLSTVECLAKRNNALIVSLLWTAVRQSVLNNINSEHRFIDCTEFGFLILSIYMSFPLAYYGT